MKNPRYKPDIPIRLLICLAGKGGDNSFAAKLRQALENLGGNNPIIASPGLVTGNADGISGNVSAPDGWIEFGR